MFMSKCLAILYFLLTIVGGIICFNNLDIKGKEFTFYGVFVFAVLQNIYFNNKIVKLEKKTNENS